MADERVVIGVVDCISCGATGVYVGYKGNKRVGSICRDCKGTGAIAVMGIPFLVKKKRADVSFVKLSPKTLRPGEWSSRITYAAFCRGKRPKVIKPRKARDARR